MKRKVSIVEIKQFFDVSNNQFEESGISLDNVRFKRENGKLIEIEIEYTRKGKDPE